MFPHIWCPGCGHGIVLGAHPARHRTTSAGQGRDRHGLRHRLLQPRCPATWTSTPCTPPTAGPWPSPPGIKLAKPELNVIVITGDGDATGHRRQPLHPRLPAQHRHHRHRLQQQHLRHDRRPGFARPPPSGKRATTAPYGAIERPSTSAGSPKARGPPMSPARPLPSRSFANSTSRKASRRKAFPSSKS